MEGGTWESHPCRGLQILDTRMRFPRPSLNVVLDSINPTKLKVITLRNYNRIIFSWSVNLVQFAFSVFNLIWRLHVVVSLNLHIILLSLVIWIIKVWLYIINGEICNFYDFLVISLKLEWGCPNGTKYPPRQPIPNRVILPNRARVYRRTDRQTDGQGDSSIPPLTSLRGV